VNPLFHSSDQVGDEPLLIAASCQIIVTNNRVAGVELASKSKPDVILMDDGFQDPAVYKDFSIITVDASLGFGNGFCIPAGPLREPVHASLKRADMCLSIGSKEAQKKFAKKLSSPLGVAHVTAEIKPLPTGIRWEGLKAFAFAGMANPEKFFLTLEGSGVKILGREALSDHQPLSLRLMRRMSTKAKSLNAKLVCTEKDFVRVPLDYRAEVLVFPVRLEIEDWSKIDLNLADLGLT
jgi:tetraacyldisaccharide 4'-kinase